MRRWIVPSLVLVVLGLAAIALVRAGRPTQASRRGVQDPPRVPPAGAFAKGGAPTRAPALDAALGLGLSRYVARLDSWATAAPGVAGAAMRANMIPELLLARAAVLTPEVRAALGEVGSAQLAKVLDGAFAAARAGTVPAAERAVFALEQALGALADELAARDLGYVLDGDLVLSRGGGGRHVVLYAYRVLRVQPLMVVGQARRALWVERLDVLAVTRPLWGLTRPHLRDALVLVDELDVSIEALVLPALAEGERLRLCDEDAHYSGSAWSQTMGTRAGAFARQELRAALEDRGEAFDSVGIALARRHRLVFELRDRAHVAGLPLPPARGFPLPREVAGAAQMLGLPRLGAALDRADALLIDLGARDALVAVREPLGRAVAAHEAQHLADAARAVPLRLPEALERITGPLRAGGVLRRDVVHARDELSAYLAQLARAEELPRLMLALVARPLLDANAWGSPEAAAALVIYQGLAGELAPLSPPFFEDGHLVRARVVDAYVAFSELPPERVARAAARLWERFFGEALPDVR